MSTLHLFTIVSLETLLGVTVFPSRIDKLYPKQFLLGGWNSGKKIVSMFIYSSSGLLK